MPKVLHLGYIAMAARDIDAACAHYTDAMGMRETDTGPDGTRWLSTGTNHHDIVLVPGDGPTLSRLGYRLDPETDLERFAKDVQGFGLEARTMSDAQPGVPAQVEVTVTPDHVIDCYASMATPAPGYTGTGVAPLRLGHSAVVSPNANAIVAFYRDCLGFHPTDTIAGIANFLTCSHEHHVVNILEAEPAKLHHIAFQLHDNGHHVTAADALLKAGVRTEWGPTRHTAGHNFASYHKDPSGTLVELYSDMDVFLAELGMCEPRPWHEHLPMRPKDWGLDELSAWGVGFEYDLAAAD